MGRQTSRQLTAFGQTTQAAVPGLLPVAQQFDAFGRPTTTTQGTRTSSFGYDPASGFLRSLTDALAQTTTLDTDAVGRVTKQTLPDRSFVQQSWDGNGNLATVTPPGKPAHTMGYSATDQLASYEPPAVSGTGPTSYDYDLDKAPTVTHRPDGSTVTTAYDAAGRVATVTTPTGGYGYGYHPVTGQLAQLSGPGNQTLSFSHDGPLLLSTAWSGDVTGSVSWTYDENFRPVSESVNGGNTVTWSRDADGLVTAVGPMTVGRDAQNGRVTSRAVGALAEQLAYSEHGELAGYSVTTSGTASFSLAFTRDDLGRIATKTETRGGVVHSFAYSYDAQGRLTDVVKDAGPSQQVAHYGYDPNGNRTEASVPWLPAASVAAGQAVYDDQDRLLQYGAVSYTYTANGELATKVEGGVTTSYSYDTQGNLLAVSKPGQVVSYGVDGQNRRVSRSVNGVVTQQWLYADQLRIVAELDGSGAVVSRFVYQPRGHAPELMLRGGQTYRLIKDLLGSVVRVVEVATGVVVQEREYDAWGAVLSDTNPGWQPFGFAGGLEDAATEAVRFGRRDLLVVEGRWSAKDPLRFVAGSPNLYGYSPADPLNHIDPSGLKIMVCHQDVSFPWPFPTYKPQHVWLKTGIPYLTKGAEAGMAGGFWDMSVEDHSGNFASEEVECSDIDEDQVDEDCVESTLKDDLASGKHGGMWRPGNMCHDYVAKILTKCEKGSPKK
jgi:RHS repeat-associated protein